MALRVAFITKETSLPSTWAIGKVADVADINRITLKEKTYKGWIEYIDITSVDKHKLLGTQLIDFNSAPSRARRVVRDNDILISTVRPNLKHFVFIKKANQITLLPPDLQSYHHNKKSNHVTFTIT